MPTQMDQLFKNKGKTPQCPVCEQSNWEDGSQLKMTANVWNPSNLPVVGGERYASTIVCAGCGYVMMFRA